MRFLFALLALCNSAVAAQIPEKLQYTINWPSGLSLGEGRIEATPSGAGWKFEMEFEAAVPGFRILDRFTSTVGGDQCSVLFEKNTAHGKRKSEEKIAFENAEGKATRQTVGGGKSEFTVPACAKDALAFLFHIRKELAQGRIPHAQNIYYGAAYRVRMESKGSQRIKIGDAYQDADRVLAYVKGPASEMALEAFFGKDPARTPLLVKVPLGMATFSVELVR
ncbi:MAG: DUF3108 domain-containing protein [Candidatus Solibacter usitatus]|nr:DUF3108 domain-containing protein [Candidatus Solibacter usitatus]